MGRTSAQASDALAVPTALFVLHDVCVEARRTQGEDIQDAAAYAYGTDGMWMYSVW